MNLATIQAKISELELRKQPYQTSIDIATEKIGIVNGQIKILHELIGTTPITRRDKGSGFKVKRGANFSNALRIIGNATEPMTANDVRQQWPDELKVQSIYPTLKDLTKRRKLDRVQVTRDDRKPCFGYMLKGKIQARHLGT